MKRFTDIRSDTGFVLSAFEQAFDHCRTANKPVIVEIVEQPFIYLQRWRLYPSGAGKQLDIRPIEAGTVQQESGE